MNSRPILLDVPDALAGERVVVRRFQDEDAEPLFFAIEDSRDHIRRFLPWPDLHGSADDSLEFIRRTQSEWAVRSQFGMGIFLRESGEFLGGVGLHPHDWSVPSFEIGYWIRESAEGRGYVTEAVKLVSRFAFELCAAQRVMIRCDARNVRSKAVPERLGYQFEGTTRRGITDSEGVPCDVLVYSLLPEEYSEIKRGW